MFERLILKDFGRFADTELELGRTTLVVGSNESGKTTVFDAITSCLAPGSVDTRRYGEGARAHRRGSARTSTGICGSRAYRVRRNCGRREPD